MSAGFRTAGGPTHRFKFLNRRKRKKQANSWRQEVVEILRISWAFSEPSAAPYRKSSGTVV